MKQEVDHVALQPEVCLFDQWLLLAKDVGVSKRDTPYPQLLTDEWAAALNHGQ